MNQRGQALILVLVVITIGFIFLGAFFALLQVSLSASGDVYDRSREHYAAAAPLEAVKADLLQGTDALADDYSPPQVTLNLLDAQLSIASPSGPRPPLAYFYMDPGTATGLASLQPGGLWPIELWGVEAGSEIEVNWAFTSAEGSQGKWKITVWKDNNEIKDEDGHQSPGYLKVTAPSSGNYLVTFRNKEGEEEEEGKGKKEEQEEEGKGKKEEQEEEEPLTLASRPFNRLDGEDFTWVRAKLAGREYLITTIAGSTTLKAFLRQLPGPNSQIPQDVVEWWLD